MAVPKKRTSKQKKGQRRAHYKVTPISVSRCASCNEPAMSHQACPSCGEYRGRKVIAAAD